MPQAPYISVIVPVYNVERYVKLCINSILNQTFQEFEIIIIDDFSTDNSYKICNELYGNNEKVRIIRHEKNMGLGSARNTGIVNAHGKYIYFVDSDDAILPNALEVLCNVAEKTGADVVHTSRYYETNQDDDKSIKLYDSKIEKELHNKVGFLDKNVLYRLNKCWQSWGTEDGIRPMAWLNLYRTDIFTRFSLRFEPIISEDELFSFELFCRIEKFFIIDAVLYLHRGRTGSIMMSYTPKRLTDGIVAMRRCAEKMKSVMNELPEFSGNTPLQEYFIYKIFEGFFGNHIMPFYNKELNKKLDVSITSAIEPIFKEHTILAKYSFNTLSKLKTKLVSSNHLVNQLQQKNQSLVQSHQNLYQNAVAIFNRCPITFNKIVFINFNGKGYGCNPKYIAKEILRQNLNYELVWLVLNMNEPMPEKIRKVKLNSLDAVYELSTAKVIITNVKNALPFTKKSDQFFIMTWHGGPIGLKKMERECEEQLSPSYVKDSKANSAITDLMIVSNNIGFNIVRNFFWYDGKIMKTGLPRNDILFNHSKDTIANLKKSLNIPLENKVLLYGPTFRDDVQKSIEVYKFDAEKLLDVMKKKFGGEWTLLLRFHPNMANFNVAQVLYKVSDNIIDVTKYPDPQELIIISDVVISDYSGFIFDFISLHKPAFIFAKDLDTFPKERGLKPIYYEFPVERSKTESELFNCIENFDIKKYNAGVDDFLSKIESYDDGHASERVVNVIKSVINKDDSAP